MSRIISHLLNKIFFWKLKCGEAIPCSLIVTDIDAGGGIADGNYTQGKWDEK
jgi:hypothetical protein